MSTIDYLVHVPDGLAAHADTIVLWTKQGESQAWEFSLPVWCGALQTQGWKQEALPWQTDEAGNALAPPQEGIAAPGDWLIITIGNGNPIPEVVAPFVVSSGLREEGLPLPDGIVALSPIWAGMFLRRRG
jgi:hypothetical protein